MKNITPKTVVLAIALGLFAFSTSNAQRWAGGDGSPVLNPNGGADFSAGGPVFRYYEETGSFTIVNAGPNGTVDSTDNMTLASDDAGLVSLLITMQDAENANITASLDGFEDGIAWAAPVGFNGKIQLSGNAISASFLPIVADERELFVLDSGLALDMFRDDDGNIGIETGVNFNFGQPGNTLFSVGDPIASGAFEYVPAVPEPSTVVLLGSAVLAIFGIARRRK